MSIKQTLIKNESRNSSFEESLRQLPLSVLTQFGSSDNLNAIKFDLETGILPIKEDVKPHFKNILRPIFYKSL